MPSLAEIETTWIFVVVVIFLSKMNYIYLKWTFVTPVNRGSAESRKKAFDRRDKVNF